LTFGRIHGIILFVQVTLCINKIFGGNERMKSNVKRVVACIAVIIMLICAVPTADLAGLDLGLTASAASYKVGDIIEYGNYPQSKVTDSKTLAALNSMAKNWKSLGYYSGTGPYDGEMAPSDYTKYADIKYNGAKYRAIYFTKYRPYYTGNTNSSLNSYQDNNGYYINTTYYFKFEPLKWRVLDPSTGFIMCENLIDSQAYHNTIYDGGNYYYQDSTKTTYANDYAKSSIRKWLNDNFYNTAFNSSQKSNIKTTTLNNDCPWDSKYNSAPTNDKIFLLSYDEVKTDAYGFGSDPYDHAPARRAQGTDYAKCQGLWVSTSSSYYGNSWWRLRSPRYNSNYACGVDDSGYSSSSCSISDADGGVRPACKLSNLKSDISQSETAEEHKHTFGAWKVAKKATYTAIGTKTRTCTVCGKIETQSIAKLKTTAITQCTISVKNVVYTGKALKPTVTVKNGKTTLKAGTHYTITYKNNTKIGKATVTITGIAKNGYSGTKTLTFNIIPANVKNLKATQTTTSVTISWSKVAGAKGYRVYKYDTKTKKWVKVADTTKTTYTVKKLKAGTSYKYAVKAYTKSGNTTYWSASYAQLSTATKPATPTLKATAGKKQAALSWNKISGASGYVVYMATGKNGSFKKVATIKKGSTVKYTKKSLKKGTTYKFKIMAYKTVSGKNIYSGYSAVKTVKAK